MRILITGASGFVGRPLAAALVASGHIVRAATRSGQKVPHTEFLPGMSLTGETDWRTALGGIDVVVHLAAHVHQMDDSKHDALERYRAVNTHGSLRLAQQAVEAGVRRFVFMSSAKVWGEDSGAAPFKESLPPKPGDPYAQSKFEAEEGLKARCAASSMEFVILRPPLVFGPEVRANFLRLLRAVARGIPLPFGSIDNRRSLIGVSNLVDVAARCIAADAAANRVFGVADVPALSTAELIRRMARHLDRAPRLLAIPAPMLTIAGKVMGLGAEMERLTGNLVLDTATVQSVLGWHPPFGTDAELARTVAWYKARPAT